MNYNTNEEGICMIWRLITFSDLYRLGLGADFRGRIGTGSDYLVKKDNTKNDTWISAMAKAFKATKPRKSI